MYGKRRFHVLALYMYDKDLDEKTSTMCLPTGILDERHAGLALDSRLRGGTK